MSCKTLTQVSVNVEMDQSVDRYLHKKFKKQLSTKVQEDVQDNVASSIITIPAAATATELQHQFSSSKSQEYGGDQEEPPTSISAGVKEVSSPAAQNQSEKISGGGKYMCPYCNLACSKPSVLQKHIRAHTNERPYPCDSCGFSFKTRSNLYKHRRSRTHANRVMGNKAQEITGGGGGGGNGGNDEILEFSRNNESSSPPPVELLPKNKPYKPRFHTKNFFDGTSKENNNINTNGTSSADLLSSHINDIINKNNSIVNSTDLSERMKKRDLSTSSSSTTSSSSAYYNNNVVSCVENGGLGVVYDPSQDVVLVPEKSVNIVNNGLLVDEPLNLTKNRKRCMSEVTEPTVQKSLIKELLLKNLYADTNMQCPHCKMIFQTVTELEIHKLRCKGNNKIGAKYSRSSSVNVASILTQNKNAFDNIPQLQNTVFQTLKSPGPFLGKTRLVDNDKTKSFSFEDVPVELKPQPSPTTTILMNHNNHQHLLQQTSLLTSTPSTVYNNNVKEKKVPFKLFGGEVKVAQSSGEIKSFRIDNLDEEMHHHQSQISENRVVVKSLQSGGTVSHGKNYEPQSAPPILLVDKSPSILINNNNVVNLNSPLSSSKFKFEPNECANNKYTSIADFSQKAVQLLAPEIKQLRLSIPPCTVVNPVNLVVNGKIVRHVPGIPGPVVPITETETSSFLPSQIIKVSPRSSFNNINIKITPPENFEKQRSLLSPLQIKINSVSNNDFLSMVEKDNKLKEYDVPACDKVQSSPSMILTTNNRSSSSSVIVNNDNVVSNVNVNNNNNKEAKKFARPNSLALIPSMSAIKQHHGLTPTMFNQILISPDTPRVAKKYMQHFLHGNYFSYLGLKTSTKSVYCTLNKTQPFYVPHFKKLSMYSEWRQQDDKADKLYVSAYDSRQRQQNYSVCGKEPSFSVVHSSYKFVAPEPTSSSSKCELGNGGKQGGGGGINAGGSLIGRGRYVCDQCGIRCKKPSMLKKHIRTHSNVRPYTCSHCNFSFKTKGNLTKHMKSKVHTRNYAASSSSNSSAVQSIPSSDSDTEDSGMDSSDESTRQHEAAYGLLSLSQKSQNLCSPSSSTLGLSSPLAAIHLRRRSTGSPPPKENFSATSAFMNSEQIAQINKKNYAKNKILDDQNEYVPRLRDDLDELEDRAAGEDEEQSILSRYLGKTCYNNNQFTNNLTLTYPYTSVIISHSPLNPHHHQHQHQESELGGGEEDDDIREEREEHQHDNIRQFQVIKKYESSVLWKNPQPPPPPIPYNHQHHHLEANISSLPASLSLPLSPSKPSSSSVIGVVNGVITNEDVNVQIQIQRKRRMSYPAEVEVESKLTRMEHEREREHEHEQNADNDEVMDLSVSQPSSAPLSSSSMVVYDLSSSRRSNIIVENSQNQIQQQQQQVYKQGPLPQSQYELLPQQQQQQPKNENQNTPPVVYDNSAMETLADVATKQVKIEKNLMAKNVASEFLKLVTKNEYNDNNHVNQNQSAAAAAAATQQASAELNEYIVKSEENKKCNICSKNFSKPSHLRLHMNIHYLERPFRCDSCSVSFRTKGHLQKHERSASHYNKLTSAQVLASSEPRPFKCSDCNIAFRIHGHLAKHLRSKMHIMKLECLAKIPFGLYAELERSNSLLTEINTTDGDQCLQSLKMLAKKVFVNDPSKLTQVVNNSSSSSVSGNNEGGEEIASSLTAAS